MWGNVKARSSSSSSARTEREAAGRERDGVAQAVADKTIVLGLMTMTTPQRGGAQSAVCGPRRCRIRFARDTRRALTVVNRCRGRAAPRHGDALVDFLVSSDVEKELVFGVFAAGTVRGSTVSSEEVN